MALRQPDCEPFTADDAVFWYKDIMMDTDIMPQQLSRKYPVFADGIGDSSNTRRYNIEEAYVLSGSPLQPALETLFQPNGW